MKRTLRALLGLAGGAAAAACAGDLELASQRVAQLPGDFVVHSILEDPEGAPVLLGYQGGPFAPLAERTLALYRVEGESPARTLEPAPGWIAASASAGASVWAVQATPHPDRDGSAYAVLVSEDGGRSWERRGAIPSLSVTALAVSGRGWGWATGALDLWRTTDGGRTWTQVSVPGPRGVQRPNVAAPEPGVVLVGGPSLRRSRDGGETWQVLSEHEVLATDGTWVTGRDGERVRVGRIDGAAVAWGPSLEAALLPDAVAAWGDDGVIVRAAPVGSGAGRGVALLSAHGGDELSRTLLRGDSDTGMVGLGPGGRVWRLEGDRSLKRLTLSRPDGG